MIQGLAHRRRVSFSQRHWHILPNLYVLGSSAATGQEVQTMDVDRSTPPSNLFAENVEIIDGQDDSKAPALSQASVTPNAQLGNTNPEYPGGFAIDVCFEASKLPLDVAIFNSVRAVGGDDKIRKYLQAVLVVGGTARMAGVAHALESRSDIRG